MRPTVGFLGMCESFTQTLDRGMPIVSRSLFLLDGLPRTFGKSGVHLNNIKTCVSRAGPQPESACIIIESRGYGGCALLEFRRARGFCQRSLPQLIINGAPGRRRSIATLYAPSCLFPRQAYSPHFSQSHCFDRQQGLYAAACAVGLLSGLSSTPAGLSVARLVTMPVCVGPPHGFRSTADLKFAISQTEHAGAL
jgi:hypothetical protein